MSTTERTASGRFARIEDAMTDEALSARFLRRYSAFLRDELGELPPTHPLHGEFTRQLHGLEQRTTAAPVPATVRRLRAPSTPIGAS